MSERTEQREVPAKTTTVVVAVVCDLCGAEAKSRYNWGGETWERDETKVKMDARPTVEHGKGSSYPEGGWGTVYRVDICPTCFREKLVPWLREQGADIIEEEYDF